MKIRDLMEHWEKHAGAEMTVREFSVKLPKYDAARILALTEMYPIKTEAQIISELLGAALDELEEAFPYAKGEKVVAEDEYQDPVYEDVGPTPAFLQKTQKHLRLLESEPENGFVDS
jgi:hypothetical protein